MDDTRAKSLEKRALNIFSQRPQEFLFWSVLSKNWNLYSLFFGFCFDSRYLPSKILKWFYRKVSPLPKLRADSVFTLCLLSSVNLKIIKLLLSVPKNVKLRFLNHHKHGSLWKSGHSTIFHSGRRSFCFEVFFRRIETYSLCFLAGFCFYIVVIRLPSKILKWFYRGISPLPNWGLTRCLLSVYCQPSTSK